MPGVPISLPGFTFYGDHHRRSSYAWPTKIFGLPDETLLDIFELLPNRDLLSTLTGIRPGCSPPVRHAGSEVHLLHRIFYFREEVAVHDHLDIGVVLDVSRLLPGPPDHGKFSFFVSGSVRRADGCSYSIHAALRPVPDAYSRGHPAVKGPSRMYGHSISTLVIRLDPILVAEDVIGALAEVLPNLEQFSLDQNGLQVSVILSTLISPQRSFPLLRRLAINPMTNWAQSPDLSSKESDDLCDWLALETPGQSRLVQLSIGFLVCTLDSVTLVWSAKTRLKSVIIMSALTW
ncbi:hypothetical protein B0H11DRAFT_1910212 [Mycena galericulata]|nr:hypothetical protein B0H11DRAFT_1910212 [Mycena galericulata]